MKSFNVIFYDFNGQKFVPYDVIPIFERFYDNERKKPKTFEEFKEFVTKWGKWHFWARCEYEVVLESWPKSDHHKKIDIWWQIEMNLDVVVEILMNKLHVEN